MKIYDSVELARRNGEKPIFIPKICPYCPPTNVLDEDDVDSTRLCGNWCPHFRLSKSMGTGKIGGIILKCVADNSFSVEE